MGNASSMDEADNVPPPQPTRPMGGPVKSQHRMNNRRGSVSSTATWKSMYNNKNLSVTEARKARATLLGKISEMCGFKWNYWYRE